MKFWARSKKISYMSLPQRNCSTPTSTEGLECASQREQRLLVVSVNVGGLTITKLNLLEEKTQQLSILMLQELHESGYKMLTERVKVSSSKGKWFSSKPPTGAAGVATYLAEELACNVSTVQSTSDRILKVVLQGTGKKKINVVNCYAPHCGLGRESYRKFLKELSVVTKNLNKRRTLLLGGDFNAQKEKFDHVAIMVELRKFQRGKERWEKTPQKDLSQLLLNKQLAQQLDHKITLELLKLNEEERDYEALTQIVPKLVKDLVPEQSNNTVEQGASDQTRELLRRKNSLWDTSTVGERKELTNAVKRSARKDKINWYIETASKIQSLFEQNRTREAYSLLNLVKPTAKIYARITKDDKGNKVDTCQRLKILSDYIASQQLPPIPKIHLTQDERVHYCRPIYEPVPEEHINSNPPLMDEVMVCIRQLKNNRATGVDCINNEVLKASSAVQKILLREIQELFRKTSLSQRMKKQFCLRKIIHIYKQKGEKNSPGSYRPIALLNTAFKLTTKIIHNRLQPIINKLPSYQAGFRSGHSTTNKIEILNNIVKKKLLQNTKLKLLFIDFQKAFDSVNHDFIQLSLKEHGVPSKLRKLIRVLYKNATVKVSEGKHLSKTYLGAVFNSSGIAQEHVLSSLDKCEARLPKYRDILSCNTLTRKVKRQPARSMKLNFLTRKRNSILNNVPIQEYRFCEGDLDIQKILLEQRRKYVEANDATADRQVHILREAGINNHLEPKDPEYVSPTEPCRKLGLEEDEDIDPVPPIQDPPNHGPPQPIRLRRTYNVPGTGSRIPSRENYLEQAARYRGTAPARINPLTYVSELLGLTGTS
eukprot:augustus_masked-scaffold_15-processed-gene-2.11-mRNA-1 protein AED:1.00 eAED:1.00 QI:0/0/0/0/1/1/4/0/823